MYEKIVQELNEELSKLHKLILATDDFNAKNWYDAKSSGIYLALSVLRKNSELEQQLKTV